MEYGVIDIGSNTIRLCIYKQTENKFTRLLNTKETAGLIGYKKDGYMTLEGIERACEVLQKFKTTLSIIKIEKLFVFTTASLRNITNSKEVIQELEEKTGFTIDLVSGEREARLGFMGASRANKLKNGLLIDIGGGSTELLQYKDGDFEKCVSLNFGSLSLYSNMVEDVIPSKKEYKAISEYVEKQLKDVDFIQDNNIDTILGIGGSIRTIKKMCMKRYKIQEREFNCEYISDILRFVRDEPRQGAELILKVAPDRIHTAIPGMIIADEIAKYINAKKIIVSSFGLREGYLYDKLNSES